jgi:hypothetical protein
MSTSIDGDVEMDAADNTMSQLHEKRRNPGSMVCTKAGKGMSANV